MCCLERGSGQLVFICLDVQSKKEASNKDSVFCAVSQRVFGGSQRSQSFFGVPACAKHLVFATVLHRCCCAGLGEQGIGALCSSIAFPAGSEMALPCSAWLPAHLVSGCPNPVSLDEISQIIPANLRFVSCHSVGMLSAWLSTALSKTDPHLVFEAGMGELSSKN